MFTSHQLPDEVRTVLSVGDGLATRRSLERVGVGRADLDAWCQHGLVARATRGVCAEPLIDATRQERFRRFVQGVLLARAGADLVVPGPAALVL